MNISQKTLFGREYSKYDIVQPLDTKCPCSGHTIQLHAKGYVVPLGGTIIYLIFSYHNELYVQCITFYHFYSIKVVVIQLKTSHVSR